MKTLTKQQRKEAFKQAQTQGTHELAPRKGEYVFQSNSSKALANGSAVSIVNTLWKSPDDAVFFEGLTFEIATLSFYHVKSNGPKHLTIEQLTGKLVVVTQVEVIRHEGKQIVVLNWNVLDELPTIEKAKSLFQLSSPTYNQITKLENSAGLSNGQYIDAVYDDPDTL